MATAVVAEPVALHEPQAKESSDTSHAQQQHEKALRFQEQPWASTQRVSLLTGAERDATIAQDISQLIGYTPLLELHSLTSPGQGRIAAKLEGFNPQGSVKDRIALSAILDAEEQGIISPDKTTILEITSGNTGIGLATVGLLRGYKVKVVIPEYYSVERRITLLALGAEIVVTAAEKGVPGAIEKLEELHASIPGSWIAGQFTNHANSKVHYETTGPEIWKQTQGKVDILVAGAGTGGTITGVGRYLLERNSGLKVYAVEPQESAVISGQEHHPHKIQGLGPGFVPDILDTGLIDEIIPIPSAEAIAVAKQLALKEGVFVGISSGAAAAAAAKVAARPENAGKLIVTVFPSYGERYQSTDLLKEEKEAALNATIH